MFYVGLCITAGPICHYYITTFRITKINEPTPKNTAVAKDRKFYTDVNVGIALYHSSVISTWHMQYAM
jgi:hypothetical protein